MIGPNPTLRQLDWVPKTQLPPPDLSLALDKVFSALANASTTTLEQSTVDFATHNLLQAITLGYSIY